MAKHKVWICGLHFLLLGSIITLGLYDDLCRYSKCLWSKEKEGVIGRKASVHHIGLWYYKPLVVAIKKYHLATNTLASIAWKFLNDG